MPTNPLFAGQEGWKISSLPAPFNSWSARNTNPEAISDFSTGRGYATPHAYIIKAIQCYIEGDAADISLVEVGAGQYATEWPQPDGRTHLAVLAANGKLSAAMVETTGRYVMFPPLGSKSDLCDLSQVFLMVLPILEEKNTRVADALATIRTSYASTGCDWSLTTAENQFCHVCDAVYFALTQANSGINVNLAAGGGIDLLSENSVSLGTYSGNVLCGNPNLLMGVQGTSSANGGTVSFAMAKKEFKAWADSQTWTDEEKALIPSFPDDYPVLPESLKMARRYINTRNDRRPMSNFLWRAGTSYGKSTGVELMAAILNMPLLRLTCSSSMDKQEFLSDYVPNTDVSSDIDYDNLPTFEDMSFDPVTAYKALTGKDDQNATPDMCLKAYGEACARKQGGNTMFKHVSSNFVIALSKGYIVEIQEMSRIKDPGLLVALNEYDRQGARIPLVDGTFTTRHPNAMVVYTDNTGYVSCRAVDPSVIRRMAFVIDSKELSKEDTIARVVYNTEFPNRTLLNEMYDVWSRVREHCKDREITDGSISITELEMWAQAVLADDMKNVKDNCLDCVVSKATSDPYEQEQIINSVIEIHLKTVA